MASQRNRILNLVSEIEKLGIKVNIDKNKAWGNKGYFKAVNNAYRIDIAKGLNENEILRILVHEFSHFIHYKYDKSLKSLDFITENISDEVLNEMIELTVDAIPKKDIEPLFNLKNQLTSEINSINPNFINIKSTIELHHKKKVLNRINSKISRLNKYYNSPTELFARSMEYYILKPDLCSKKAPKLTTLYNEILQNNKIPMLKILKQY